MITETSTFGDWSGKGWTINVTGAAITVAQPSRILTVTGWEATGVEVRRRWFRWTLLRDGQPLLRLPGLTRTEASSLQQAVRRLALTSAVTEAVAWHRAVTRLLDTGRAEQRWVPTEAVDSLLATRPEPALLDRVRAAGCESSLTNGELEAVRFLDVDLEFLVTATNEQIMTAELTSRRSFFDTIEKSPLTEEQSRAVVCFDNRVQVLAAAGSGKTSVMVARAAYAVSRGFVPAHRILLLAFNKAAAAELQQRVSASFAAAGIDSSGVRATTFHAFGLDVIGRATGKKPRLARWLDQSGDDIRMVLRIVDQLRDTSPSFRYRWDLYRMLFANAPTDLTEHQPDGYDKATRQAGYRTFAGEVVKSAGERLIANFLYLNGVKYEYERPYDVDVADATHSQYRPDFYYPGIDVWHEHWALDRDGNPPASFEGYAEAMAWKRSLHAQHGTTLVESAWAEVMFGDGLTKLRDDLTRLGLTFDWNPDRPLGEAKPIRHEDLTRLVRTFMTHVKSNAWTAEHLERRLTSDLPHRRGFRTRLFLDLYWQIHGEWERRLAAESSVDFEDMLVQAAEHLEAGSVDCPYELIMVDEFQDASRARARLVRALMQTPGRFLLAVGDDWQSINRFAGADLSVMTDFETWFGRGPQLALTTTFRCPQTICNVARAFVSKNPNQFGKPMRSALQQDPGAPVAVITSDDAADALASYLGELSADVAAGRVPCGPSGMITVDVLGRYGWLKDEILPRRSPSNLRVTFRTVHGSKGLEADYVVVAGMSSGTYGFPSGIADDPLLDLAMPAPESFRYAEERRLFYVSLTRACRQVTLITPTRHMSPFVAELLDDPHVTVTGHRGATVEICPGCRQGTMVERHGKFGPFLGCSNFPACEHTRDLQSQPVGSSPTYRRR